VKLYSTLVSFLWAQGQNNCTPSANTTVCPMKDFFGSILESWQSRLTDPFLGAFSVSFLGYNWQMLLWVFSDVSVETTIMKIDKLFTWWSVGVPLISASILTLLYPLLRALIIWVRELIKNLESKLVRLALSEERAVFWDERASNVAEINRLKTCIDGYIKQMLSVGKAHKNFKDFSHHIPEPDTKGYASNLSILAGILDEANKLKR